VQRALQLLLLSPSRFHRRLWRRVSLSRECRILALSFAASHSREAPPRPVILLLLFPLSSGFHILVVLLLLSSSSSSSSSSMSSALVLSLSLSLCLCCFSLSVTCPSVFQFWRLPVRTAAANSAGRFFSQKKVRSLRKPNKRAKKATNPDNKMNWKNLGAILGCILQVIWAQACTWQPDADSCDVLTFVSSAGFYSQYSQGAWLEANMFAEFVNTDEATCGLGGLGVRVRLVPYEVASSPSLLPGLVQRIGSEYGNTTRLPCAVLLPEGDLSLQASTLLQGIPAMRSVPWLSGTSASAGLYRHPISGHRIMPNIFGTVTPARQYHLMSMDMIKAQGYKRVAIVSSTLPLDQSVCNRTVPLAEFHNLDVVHVSVLDHMSPTYQTDIISELQRAQGANPHALITCLSYQCDLLDQMMPALNFNPPIHSTFECVNQAVASTIGRNTTDITINSGRLYFMSPAQFDCRMSHGESEDLMFPFDVELSRSVAQSSTQQFCRAFEAFRDARPEQFPNVTTSSLTGGQLAALYSLWEAVRLAKTTSDPSAIVAALNEVSISTPFGTVRFNKYGENFSRQMALRQLLDVQGNTALILPVVELAKIPMPQFWERSFHPAYMASRVERAMMGLAAVSTAIFVFLAILVILRRRMEAVRVATIGVFLRLIAGAICMVWAHLTWSIFDTKWSCALRIPVWGLAYFLVIGSLLHASHRVWALIRQSEIKFLASRNPTARARCSVASKLRSVWRFLTTSTLHPLLPLSIAFLVAWMSVGTLQPGVIPGPDPLRPAYSTIVCNGVHSWVFSILTCVLVCIMLLFTLLRTIQLRNIDPTLCPLSQMRHISILVSLLLVSWAILISAEFVLPNNSDTAQWKFVIRSIILLLNAWVTIGFFLPDFTAIIRGNNPHITTKYTTTTNPTQPKSKSHSGAIRRVAPSSELAARPQKSSSSRGPVYPEQAILAPALDQTDPPRESPRESPPPPEHTPPPE
jgi:hypothetical protein